MLRLIGKPYIFQHCAIAWQQEQLALSYQTYMTDALAGFAGMSERWFDQVSDFIDTRPRPPQQTAEEVITHIKNGLMGGEET